MLLMSKFVRLAWPFLWDGTLWKFGEHMVLNADWIGYTMPVTKSAHSSVSAGGGFSSIDQNKLESFYNEYADFLGDKGSDQLLMISFGYIL